MLKDARERMFLPVFCLIAIASIPRFSHLVMTTKFVIKFCSRSAFPLNSIPQKISVLGASEEGMIAADLNAVSEKGMASGLLH